MNFTPCRTKRLACVNMTCWRPEFSSKILAIVPCAVSASVFAQSESECEEFLFCSLCLTSVNLRAQCKVIEGGWMDGCLLFSWDALLIWNSCSPRLIISLYIYHRHASGWNHVIVCPFYWRSLCESTAVLHHQLQSTLVLIVYCVLLEVDASLL